MYILIYNLKQIFLSMLDGIQGKIILKKISGDGEITGTTEMNLDSGHSVSFDDIQFTEPGDYKVSVSFDGNINEKVPTKILSFHVLTEDTVISQDKKGMSASISTPKRTIITQILQPTLQKPIIHLDLRGLYTDYTEFISHLGMTPLVSYYDYLIDRDNVRYMEIYHMGVLPMLDLEIVDTHGLFKKGETMPREGNVINIFLNATSKNIKSILISFKIFSIKNIKQAVYRINGFMNIPNIYEKVTDVNSGTSFKVLCNICQTIGLGFNSNIDETKDMMTWRAQNNRLYEYMSDIVNHSFIDDDSFMIGYIDYYYCFNYVNLQKEKERDNKNDCGLDTSGESKNTITTEDEKIMSLTLTNDKGAMNGCNYITDIETINDSTTKEFNYAYNQIGVTYDVNNLQILQFNQQPKTSNGENTIILKGTSSKDVSNFDKSKVYVSNGIVDDDNTCKDFEYAKNQNDINLNSLNKIALNVTLPIPNYNLYRFQKISVVLVNDVQTPSMDKFDYRLSTNYLISDIRFIWDGKKLSQKLRLITNELGKTIEERMREIVTITQSNTKTNANTNINPIVASVSGTTTSNVTILPNEEYNIGEFLNVINQNTKVVYELTITQILANGTDVRADLENTNELLKDNLFDVSTKDTFIFKDGTSSSTSTNDSYKYVVSYTASIYNNVSLGDEYTENVYSGGSEEFYNIDNSYTVTQNIEHLEDAFNEAGGIIGCSDLTPIAPGNGTAITQAILNDFYKKTDALKCKTHIGTYNLALKSGIKSYLNDMSFRNAFGFNTTVRLAMFLGQMAEESGGFKWEIEQRSESSCNLNYAKRLGNGSVSSGDGYRYRGRGYIQITGKCNYQALNAYLKKHNTGYDVITNPNIISGSAMCFYTAAWWLATQGHRTFKYTNNMSVDNIKHITKIVNGGYTNLDIRCAMVSAYWNILGKY